MGKHFSLVASDSFKLGAYRADPSGAAKGGIVVIQEIFGVNHHIRAVCDRLAADGYAAIAPAVFDRQQPNFECGYSPDEIANARKFVANPDWGAMLRDVQAAIDEAKKSGALLRLVDCGLHVAQHCTPIGIGDELAGIGDFVRRIAALEIRLLAIEYRGSNCRVAIGGEAVAYRADVVIDAKDFLDDDDAALGRPARVGAIGAEFETVRRNK